MDQTETTPRIEYGNREGQYFLRGHFDTLTELAAELAANVPDATGWRIWYDQNQDYHRLAFRIGADAYMVRYYKVFALVKNGKGDQSDIGPAMTFGWKYDGLVRHVLSEVHAKASVPGPLAPPGAGPEAAEGRG